MPELTTAGQILNSQLNLYDNELIRVQYQAAWSLEGKNHVTRGDLPVSARKIISTYVDSAGEAAIYDGKTIDIPVVQLGADQVSYTALMFIIGCRWNEFEVEAIKFGSQNNPGLISEDPIVAQYRESKEIMDRTMHMSILFGNQARSFRGMLNNPDIPVDTANTGFVNAGTAFAPASAKSPFATTSPMTDPQLYEWLSNSLMNFNINRGRDGTDTYMYVEPNLKRRLNGIMTNGTTMSVEEQLIKAGFVKEIRAVFELDSITNNSAFVSRFNANLPASPVWNRLVAGEGRFIIGTFANAASAYRRYKPFQRTPVEKIPLSFDYGSLAYAVTSEWMLRQPMNYRIFRYNNTVA